MPSSRRAAIALLGLLAAACERKAVPKPVLLTMEPAAGYVGTDTPVVVRGRGFAARVEQSSTGGAPSVDTRFRAWLGDAASCSAAPGCATPAPCPAELTVRWVDLETLEATVPKCLPGGRHPLSVESPFGVHAGLASGFTVSLLAASALTSTLAVQPGTVSLGQTITLTATVDNTGSGDVNGVAPGTPLLHSVDGGAATLLSGPTPASIGSLAPGGSGTFQWTYSTSARGHLDLSADVAGTDAFSGTTVSAPAGTPASVFLQRAPVLTAALSVPASAPEQTPVPVTMTVTNTGDADAVLVAPTALSFAPGSLPLGLLDGPAPARATVPGLGAAPLNTATFTWHYWSATTPGSTAFVGGASGFDANAPLSAVTAAPAVSPAVTIGTADLVATLVVSPAVASLGQLVTLTLQVDNPGSAPLIGVTPGSVFATGSGTATQLSGPSPTRIDPLPALGRGTFTWTYRAETSGVLSFSTTARGTDSFSGNPVTTGAVVSNVLTLQAPTVLVPTLTASKATASTGQAVTMTLALRNSGGASASVTAVTPTISPATGSTCTAASPAATPATPFTILGGITQNFTWTCTGTAAAVYTYGATVAATDANTGLAVGPVVTGAAVTVQTAAVLAPTLTASTASASTGQAVTMTLALKNNGTASASVTAVTPSLLPATGSTCTAAAPATPVTILGGATQNFTWTCTATVAAVYTYGATVAATDVNSALAIGPVVTGVAVTVQGAATLAPTLTASRATASTGQAVTMTLALKNNGTANASVTVVTPSITPVTGSTCTAAAPIPPQTIAGGATLDFTWTCTATVAAVYTYGVTVAAADAVSGANISPIVIGVPVTVQVAAVLAPTLTASAATASTGQAVTMTLALKNNGTASASATAVTPSIAPATGSTCTAASPAATPAAPVTILGGATQNFTWTCTATVAAVYTYGATVAATDVNTALAIGPVVTGVAVTVQGAAVLAPTLTASRATASTLQVVTMTLALKNNGTASASVTAVTPSLLPATGSTCTAAAPVPPQTIAGGATLNFTWTCTATVAAVYTYGATVAATDVTSGAVISPVVTGVPVTVQAAAVLAPTLTASAATASTGQAVTMTLALKNNGGASASVTAVTTTIAPVTGSTCTAASPVTPATILGGATQNFTWTCTATVAAVYTYGATVVATDANTALAIGPVVTGVAVTVQVAGVLTPVLTPSATTVSTGQAVTLTLVLTNNGASGASVASVTPTASPATSFSCTAASPVSAAIAGGGSQTFSWTCTATAAAIYTYGATVVATDATSGTNISPTVTGVAVTVQAAAVLAPTLTASVATASTGQPVTMTLALKNNGTATANVIAVGPTASPSAAPGCTAASPGSATVLGGATQNFTWSCTATAAAVYTFGATVGATDLNSGVNISPVVTGVPVNVVAAAVLAPTLTASTATASTGQAVTMTLALKNNGGASASVTAVTATASPAANVSCTAPSPATPATILGGATQNFTWSCTATVAAVYLYGATVAATDATSGANISPAVTGTSVTVQAAAVLAPTLTASTATASTGQAVTMTLALKNNGTSSASVASVAATASPATNVSCTAAAPVPPQTILGGATLNFTWTCTATVAAVYLYGATVVATDAVSGAVISPAVTGTSVTVQAAAVLAPTLTASTATASTGQAVTMTLALKNNGTSGASVASVATTASPATNIACAGASPASATIAAGATQSFTWTCTATAAAVYNCGATVVATDAVSGANISPAVTGTSVTVQAAAVLAPTLTASTATASTGQAVTMTLALKNNGTSSASVASVAATASPATNVSCTAPSPASAAIAAGATQSFTWTCTATAAAVYLYGATVVATDAVSGASISPAVTGTSVAVQAAASLSGSVSASLSTVNTGQAVTLNLTAHNAGQASALATAATPTRSGTASASCTAASPSSQPVPGGGNVSFSWTCTPTSTGSLTLGATLAGTDANSGAAVNATSSSAAVTAQSPASLVLSLAVGGNPVTASTGQALSISLTITNSGAATANLSGIAPVSGGVAAGCTAASPAPAPLAGGGNVTHGWSCTPSAAGTLLLGASVAGTDATSGAPLSAVVSPQHSVLVQTAPSLSASVAASPATASTGQQVTLTLTVNNGGQATSNATAPTAQNPVGATGCSPPAPASRVISGGGNGTFTWTCTISGTGGLIFGASVSGSDANSGAAVGPVTASTATVTGQTAAALSVTTFSTSPTTVNTGQASAVSLILRNTGGASATVTALAPTATPAASPGCGGVSPALPHTIGGGASQAFTWSCTASGSGTYDLDANLTAADANSGAAIGPGVTAIPLVVQLPAALSAVLTGPGTAVAASAIFDVTMTVSDGGGATAIGVVPSISFTTDTSVTLVSGPVPASATVAPGPPVVFTWTYQNGALGPGSATFSGSVSGTDGTSGAAIGPVTATDAVVSLDSPPPQGPAAPISAEVLLVAADPLGDGTAQALLAAWQGALWVGPGRDGSRLARVDPASGAIDRYDLALAVDLGPTPASNPAWAAAPPARSMGAAGSPAGSAARGPDDEAGAWLLAGAALGGIDRLWLGGAGPLGSRYLYAAAAASSPLDLSAVDLGSAFPAAEAAASPPLLTSLLADPTAAERVYLGYAREGPAGPALLALRSGPAGSILDAVLGPDLIDLQAAALPGAAGAGVTALSSLGGLLYVAHPGGIARATSVLPGPAGDAPGDWALATPLAAAWAARTPVPLVRSAWGGVAPRDRAVPALAAFGSCGAGPCLFAARNVVGDPTQPAAVPQLWRCDPSGTPAACAPGDWQLAAANPSGDRLLSQLGGPSSGAVTLLAATPGWLYLGFDDGSVGVQVFRAAAAPRAAGDFRGAGGCGAGTPGCTGLGGGGFGDATVTRILDFRVSADGGGSLWILAGDGNGPARLYRILD